MRYQHNTYLPDLFHNKFDIIFFDSVILLLIRVSEGGKIPSCYRCTIAAYSFNSVVRLNTVGGGLNVFQ